MTIHVNDGGTWKTVSGDGLSVNDGGTWKAVNSAYVNDGGTWKEVYPFAPQYSNDFSTTETDLRDTTDWECFFGVWEAASGVVKAKAMNDLDHPWVRRDIGNKTDCWVECVPLSANSQGPIIRANEGDQATLGYAARMSAGTLRIYRIDSSATETELADSGVSINNSTDVVRLKAIGSSLFLYKNGTEVATAVDSTHGSGYIGFGIIAATVTGGYDVIDDYAEAY